MSRLFSWVSIRLDCLFMAVQGRWKTLSCYSCRRWRLFIRAGGSACSPLLANFISTAAKRKKTHPRPTHFRHTLARDTANLPSLSDFVVCFPFPLIIRFLPRSTPCSINRSEKSWIFIRSYLVKLSYYKQKKYWHYSFLL